MADPSDPAAERASDDIEELVRLVSRRSEQLAIALGMPREAKYALLAALGGDPIVMGIAAPQPSPSVQPQAVPSTARSAPTFVIEAIRGAAHVAQFVRSFLAGQNPPAFQLSPLVLKLQGETTEAPGPRSEVHVGAAGPVTVAVGEDPSAGDVVFVVQLSDPDAGPVRVRFYRGREGGNVPPEPIGTADLSAEEPTTTQRVAIADFRALRIEAEPQG